MTRRAVRRRLEVLGALLAGPAFEDELCRRTRRQPGTLYAELARLERDGDAVTERVRRNGQPPRTAYRLPTLDERAARLALEARLRDALHAAVDGIEPKPHDTP
jgi:DNA-binding PadR family transcriptional regulator